VAEGNRRRRDPESRRRELCDAAIELLGADGPRGLSHPKVDVRAGVPPGTTSAYYRTRKALLIGAAQRLSQLDDNDLNRMSELGADETGRFSGTVGLATMVVYSGQMPFLVRTRARHELIAQAGRDPDLATVIADVGRRFESMTREAIVAWQPAGTRWDPALVDDQNFAVMHFIQGVMVDFVRGGDPAHSVERIDAALCAILNGVRQAHLVPH
jgi:DNA-binding transcriptional regulator YbjK